MNQENYFHILKKHRAMIIVFSMVGLVLSLAVSMAQPLQYRSQARVMVIPLNVGADGYQAARSAENYAITLTSVLPSMSFYDKMVLLSPSVKDAVRGDNAEAVQKTWKKTIEASVQKDTGIITLRAYGETPRASEDIVTAAIGVLEEKGAGYLGGSRVITIHMIDNPVTSHFPVRPNYPVNVFGGLAAGFAVGVAVIVMREEWYAHIGKKRYHATDARTSATGRNETMQHVDVRNRDHAPEHHRHPLPNVQREPMGRYHIPPVASSYDGAS